MVSAPSENPLDFTNPDFGFARTKWQHVPILCDGTVSIGEFTCRAGVLFLFCFSFLDEAFSVFPQVLAKPVFPNACLDARTSINMLTNLSPEVMFTRLVPPQNPGMPMPGLLSLAALPGLGLSSPKVQGEVCR